MARRPTGALEQVEDPVQSAHAGGRELLAELEHYRRRERELIALQETALDLNRSRDTNAVLNAIVRRISSVIGSDVSYLTTYEPDREDFYIRAAVGIISPRFREIRVAKDKGSCRHIVTGLQPFVTSDYAEDPRFVHDAAVDDTLRAEGIVAMAAVPLQLDAHVLGILYVADRHRRTYEHHEVALLQAIGAHAALAIENARLFEEARDAVRRLESTMAEVEAAVRVHEQLIANVASGRGVEALADTLASALSAGVMMLEPDDRVLCISAGRAKGQRALVAGGVARRPLSLSLEASRRSGHSEDVHVSVGACRAMSVVGASQTLGSLVVWRDRAFSDFDTRTIERGALVAGAILLSRERIARGLNHDFEEALRGLLNRNPEASAAFVRHAERRGAHIEGAVALLMVDPDGKSPGFALQCLQADPALRKQLAGELDGSLVVVCAAPHRDKLSASIKHALERRASMPTIVISRPLAGLADLPGAYMSCKRCLSLLLALGRRGSAVSETELAIYATLFSTASRQDLEAFVRAKLGPLIRPDGTKNARLMESLRAYIAQGLSLPRAAAASGVHVNTMRQRIEKIAHMLKLEDISQDLFEIQAALVLYRLMKVPL
ncbi:MAG: GAF domain-containing protein [Rhodoblastus sp.]|nr:GAF domain-containing protein [Rhodoblastus sp.]